MKSLALQLLDDFDSHISAKLLLRPHVDELRWRPAGVPKGFTGLHYVAFLGTAEIAESLLDMKAWDVDKADFVGRTPLIWASKNGSEGIIRLLLEKGGGQPQHERHWEWPDISFLGSAVWTGGSSEATSRAGPGRP